MQYNSTDASNELKVTVIIPTYNRCDLISNAIESVLGQSYKHYEIIIVDDGSTDKTEEVVSGFGAKVKYIYQKNAGPSAARNTGIKNAAGELIAFLDSDDVWREDKLEKQIPRFADNPRLGLVACGHEIRDQKGKYFHTTVLTDKEIRQVHKKDLYKNFVSTSSVIARAECFNEVGYFDEGISYAEDWDMWIRVLSQYEFDYIKEPLAIYGVDHPSISNYCSERNMLEWHKVLEKHKDNNANSVALFTNRKRWSWFYLNKAFVYKEKNRFISKVCLVKSIIAWPIWYPGRYYSLLKW